MISVGIHPWNIGEDWEQKLAFLAEAVAWPGVRCIGEAGLDSLRGGDLRVQREVFARQVKIAEAVNKPVIVHCVRAYSELLELKKELKVRVPMVIHGYNRKPELAMRLVEAGFYLSFGREILSRPQVQQVLREMPADRFFLETDGHPGIEIQEIYRQAAALREVTPDDLQEKLIENFNRL